MSQFISLSEAVDMSSRYRQEREAILRPSLQGLNVLPLSETFDRSGIDVLLQKPNCASLRIYYGMDADLKIHAIIVSADSSGNDLLPSATLSSTEEEEDVALERGIRCPPLCPAGSVLNG